MKYSRNLKNVFVGYKHIFLVIPHSHAHLFESQLSTLQSMSTPTFIFTPTFTSDEPSQPASARLPAHKYQQFFFFFFKVFRLFFFFSFYIYIYIYTDTINFTIFSQLLRCQFLISQNKIIKYETLTNHN